MRYRVVSVWVRLIQRPQPIEGTPVAVKQRLRYFAGAAASAAALITASMPPAGAAATHTVRMVALVPGTISITVQPTATLPTGTAGSANVSGPLGTVVVTDTRNAHATWSASATSTTFVDGQGTVSTGVSYNAGGFTTTGTVVMATAVPTNLSGTAAVVAHPTSVGGANTASWNPTLTVSLPSNALAGTYTGTVNTSVS